MRLLIDTNIFIYMATDPDSLSHDVRTLLEDYENRICISVESVRELVVSFNNGGAVSRHWSTSKKMLDDINNIYFIDVLPLLESVMKTYAMLRINTNQDHRDPSDHVIISHALTLGIPLISSDRKFPFYRSQGLDLIENRK